MYIHVVVSVRNLSIWFFNIALVSVNIIVIMYENKGNWFREIKTCITMFNSEQYILAHYINTYAVYISFCLLTGLR